MRDPRLPAALAAAGLALAAVSALASPHRDLALDALRVLAVGCFLLLLGASRVAAARSRLLAAAFLAAAAVNAVVSILQARGLYQPFPLITRGGREATGAFAGNVGYLALALALAAVLSLGIALNRRGPLRGAAAALTLLFAAALVVNQNLTSLSAAAVGAAVLLFGRFGRRAIVPMAAALLLLTAGVFAYAPMRTRASEAAAAMRAGDWDRLLSYRTAPWAAAIGMAKDRPLLGFGPGTFEAEFVSHRLAADIVHRRRLVNPLVTSTYSEAHCDYLQPFAEEGIAAGLAVVLAAALLIAGAARSARSSDGPRGAERLVLFALLAAGATAALTWFPMQRPDHGGAAPRRGRAGLASLARRGRRKRAVRVLRGLVVAALLFAAVRPEPSAMAGGARASGGDRRIAVHRDARFRSE